MASEERPKAKIGILAIGEEAFVQESDLMKDRPSDRTDGTTWEHRGVPLVILPSIGFSAPYAPVQPVQPHAIAHVLNPITALRASDLSYKDFRGE
jgi:hypothetical protein